MKNLRASFPHNTLEGSCGIINQNQLGIYFRAVAWPKYTGGSDPEKVPVPDVNSGVNVGDPGPNVCPYPIKMYMLGFPIHRNEIMQFITVFLEN